MALYCEADSSLIKANQYFCRTIASSEKEAASTPGSVLETVSRCLLSLTQAFGDCMTPINTHDIVAMRERGFCPDTIRKAEAQLELLRHGEVVANEIRRAFAGVRLGSGVGLWQAQGLDDYADAESLRRFREADEKDDWSAIPINDLKRCNSSLCFFDAEGMRFHLPAYLIADLRGEYGFGMAFCLTHLSDHGRGQFTALNQAQRMAVQTFLRHILQDPDYEFDREDILRALDTFWI